VVYGVIDNWLDVGVHYRFTYQEQGGMWKKIHQPYLDATLMWRLASWDFSNRARFEYRNREDAENIWYYRNKLQVNFPVIRTRLEPRPYLADEFFVNIRHGSFARNRVYAGLLSNLVDPVSVDVYYFWERWLRNVTWKDTHVLGIKLILSF
jgi:hypothetical protein